MRNLAFIMCLMLATETTLYGSECDRNFRSNAYDSIRTSKGVAASVALHALVLIALVGFNTTDKQVEPSQIVDVLAESSDDPMMETLIITLDPGQDAAASAAPKGDPNAKLNELKEIREKLNQTQAEIGSQIQPAVAAAPTSETALSASPSAAGLGPQAIAAEERRQAAVAEAKRQADIAAAEAAAAQAAATMARSASVNYGMAETIVSGDVGTALLSNIKGLKGKAMGAKALDLALVIDGTGSMGPFFEQVKIRGREILRGLKEIAGSGVTVRMTVIFFTDIKQNNPPVWTVVPFTSDLESLESNIVSLTLPPNGENPEVEEAWADAALFASRLSWRSDSLNQIIMITDANPKPRTTDGAFTVEEVLNIVRNHKLELVNIRP